MTIAQHFLQYKLANVGIIFTTLRVVKKSSKSCQKKNEKLPELFIFVKFI